MLRKQEALLFMFCVYLQRLEPGTHAVCAAETNRGPLCSSGTPPKPQQPRH